MKDISIIKWILSISDRDRTLAIVLVAISVLWGQGLWDKRNYNKLQAKYYDQVISRTDSCDAEKLRLVQREIGRVERTQVIIDSLTRENLKIITVNNRNIQKRSR